MKKFVNKAIDCSRIILQFLIIVIVFFFCVKMYDIILASFKEITLDFENWKEYCLIRLPRYLFSAIITSFALIMIRKLNREAIVNKGNFYHNHSQLYYWCCSKILGYKKCNLKLVPIYMQFKLVINSVFDDFFTGEETDYRVIENEDINVTFKNNKREYSNELNLILEDTYSIAKHQLPYKKLSNNTIYVSRQKIDGVRTYSPEFINKITSVVRALPKNVNKINVYATTNPKHTELISRNVFQTGGRGNVDSLNVFQQSEGKERKFEKKHKIY